MGKVLSVLRDVAFVLFVLAICGMIFIMSTGKRVSFFGYQVLRVLTASMEPTIDDNTCIIIKKVDTETLKVGDIITFVSTDPDIYGYYNTHRIEKIEVENRQKVYYTKGDASMEMDPYPVLENQVVGIYLRELPGGTFIGKLFVALSNNKVYFFVVMLPLAICLLSYIWQIIAMLYFNEEEEEIVYIDDASLEENFTSLKEHMDKLEEKIDKLSDKLEG